MEFEDLCEGVPMGKISRMGKKNWRQHCPEHWEVHRKFPEPFSREIGLNR